MIILTEQWIVPTIKNTVRFMDNFDLVRVFLRSLKLSIPSLVLWLMGFYTFFHLWLNILAELLRFGDREFYKSWWNSTTQAEYWRDWNTPVHNWLRRHVYYPVTRLGMSRTLGSLLIFFISAIFHEIVASIPLKMIRSYFFMGMMFQVPLIILTEKYTKGSQIGNIIFWVSFCILGQPMVVLLYYYDYAQSINKIKPFTPDLM
jgi:diacylglycerol O-acyltransferase-1